MATIGPAANDGDTRYINRALYAELEAFLARVRANGEVAFVAEAEIARIRRFLHAEARLLDRRDYPRWVDLLCEDFAYWVPSSYASSSLTAEVAVNFDDLRRMRDRIAYTHRLHQLRCAGRADAALADGAPPEQFRSLGRCRWHDRGDRQSLDP